MKLVLKDRAFDIERATLCASIPDPYWSEKYNPGADAGLSWGLDIHAKNRTTEDGMWGPYVYHQTLRFPIRRWVEIAGQEVEWDSPVDERTNEPNGAFYVLNHEAIPRARLRFVKRDGLAFRVQWDGVCDVFWDEEYGASIPFSLDVWATFTGIRVGGCERDTNASLRARLAQYLDVTDFTQHPMKLGTTLNDGMKTADSEFTPIEA